MARVKFLVFAVVVLGLWLAHLVVLSPAVYGRALELATAEQRAAVVAVSARAREQQLLAQNLAQQLASSPHLAALFGRSKPEAPDLDRLVAVRGVVTKAAPDALQRPLVVGVVTDWGSMFSRDDEVINAQESGLEPAALTRLSSAGSVQRLFGIPYQLYAVPVKADQSKPLATVVVGVPRLSEAALKRLLQETGTSALGLVDQGEVVEMVAADRGEDGVGRPSLAQITRTIQPNHISTLTRGSMGEFLFLGLPFGARRGELSGGSAVLEVGARHKLDSSLEVVSVYSLKPFARWLAHYQQAALWAFLILLALTAGVYVWMGREESPAQAYFHPSVPKPVAPAESVSAPAEKEIEPAPNPVAPVEHAQAEPLFGLPPELESARPAADEQSFANLGHSELNGVEMHSEEAANSTAEAPRFAPSNAASSFSVASSFVEEEPYSDEDKTRVYDFQPTAEEMGNVQEPLPPGNEYPVDATRVASVPDELLKATSFPPAFSASQADFQQAVSHASTEESSLPFDLEEQHVQEVYREFVATRERCGETGEGIGYEKFALKLKKNREQLMQKYNCRSVRFQVYVKDGKAALKATPLKA